MTRTTIGDFTLDTENPGSQGDKRKVYSSLQFAMDEVREGWGCDLIVLTLEELELMKNGGVLAWSDGEYSHYVTVKDTTI